MSDNLDITNQNNDMNFEAVETESRTAKFEFPETDEIKTEKISRPVSQEGNKAKRPRPVDKDGNPVKRPRPVDKDGNPVKRPRPVDKDGNPVKRPRPVDKDGNPVKRPRPVDKDGNPIKRPRPVDKDGNPIKRPRPVDKDGNPVKRKTPESLDTEAKYDLDIEEPVVISSKKPKRSPVLLTVLILVVITVSVVGGIFGVKYIKANAETPIATLVEKKAFYFAEDEIKELVKENWSAYFRKSYCYVGEGENAVLYKLCKGVPRSETEISGFYKEPDGLMYYHDADGNKLSKVAIDVSTYQGIIDYESVKLAGINTVIIRVGYRGYGSGQLTLDNTFYTNLTNAKAAGFNVSVYIYSQALDYNEGVEEARFVIDAIAGYDVDGYIVIDTEYLEAEGARTLDLDVQSRTDSVVGFCETVKAAGFKPMIYSNRNWFIQNLDMEQLADYDLWVAQYYDYTDFPYAFKGWQYTGEGGVPGVSGHVDINVWME